MRQAHGHARETGPHSRRSVADGVAQRGRGRGPMADLAYAVLLVAGFVLLALTLRGLEKL
ncbi:MAG TPA: hypothetical protein VNP92_16445 [Actinophytocola sp.]|nr:hypothetical protein [Actinophytocola sp.]